MRLFALLTALILSACSPYTAQTFSDAAIQAPDKFVYQSSLPGIENAPFLEDNWWTLFHSTQLASLVQEAFQNNPDIDIALSRLQAAREQTAVSRSNFWPEISTSGIASRQRFDSLTGGNPQAGIPGQQTGGFSGFQNFFSLNNALSLELDIWQRISARNKSAYELQMAESALYRSSKQLLAAEVANRWINSLEQEQLLQLLDRQIDTSKTLQELVTLRLASGEGSVLDVLQQKQQVATLESLRPGILLAREQNLIALSVLLGVPYTKSDLWLKNTSLPALPALPHMVSPLAVLYGRADVDASRRAAQAAEYEVAARVADRFPALTLGLSYDFRAADVDDLFSGSLSSMAANVFFPIIDGGRRRALVRQQEALVLQRFHEFRKKSLEALSETESALVSEKEAQSFVTHLDTRLTLSRETLKSAQDRYLNGAESYLQVLLAVQSLQSLEREFISARAETIRARMLFYRSLGDLATPNLLTLSTATSEEQHGYS